LIVLALVAGFYAFGKIQDSLDSSSGVAVPYVVGIREANAASQLNEKGLDATVHRKPSDHGKEGDVYEQSPEAGVRLDKGSAVDISVSTGPAQGKVPDVMGKSSDDAVAALTSAKLKFKVLTVFSKEDADTVVAQSPVGGKVVDQGSTVHINVSKGLQPIDIPNVVGQLYDSAAGQLQGAGFAVARRDVESSQPKETVIDQQPKGGGSAARGSTVTLYVSKGPKEATVPDVTSQDEASGQTTLEQSGFSVDVQEQD